MRDKLTFLLFLNKSQYEEHALSFSQERGNKTNRCFYFAKPDPETLKDAHGRMFKTKLIN